MEALWVLIPMLYCALGFAVVRRDLERRGRLRLRTVLDWPWLLRDVPMDDRAAAARLRRRAESEKTSNA